jgi:RNA-directed DNA polymerase
MLPRVGSQRMSVSVPPTRRVLRTGKRWPLSGWNGCRTSAHPKDSLPTWVVRADRAYDAKRLLGHLRERLAKFRLELHPDKTRLLRFGRFAAAQRKEKGESGAPQTFNFLGLTHCCGRSKSGLFLLLRHTMRSRLTAKVHEITLELRRRLHEPIVSQGKWLGAVLRGHYAYYGVPTNIEALDVFRSEVTHRWFKSLR